MVFAFAGDSTTTTFIKAAQIRDLHRQNANSSRSNCCLSHEQRFAFGQERQAKNRQMQPKIDIVNYKPDGRIVVEIIQMHMPNR